MWQRVDGALEEGRGDRAREALAEALRDLFTDEIVAGRIGHPLLTKKGRPILGELARRAAALVEDPSRGGEVARILQSSAASVDGRRPDAALVFLVNHALQLLCPTFAADVEQAVQDAKFELGARASNVEGAPSIPWPLPGWEADAAARLVVEGFRGAAGVKFNSIEDLALVHFDAPEDSLPKLPAIDDVDTGSILYRCPGCDAPRGSPVSAAGAEERCACGVPFRVPIPSLVRMAASLRAAREAASGVGRCRACGAVVQVRRGGIMRTGFCSAACARNAERFGEFVPRDGTPDAFACGCGAVLEAASGTETVPCACGLKVWVPEPPPPPRASRGAILDCACGRKVKSTAARCMYCGAPVRA